MFFEDIDASDSEWAIVECCAGAADRHFVAYVEDFRAAHALTAWAFNRPGWRT